MQREGYGHGEICWAQLSSSDPERASEFYGSVLSWTREAGGPPDGSNWVWRFEEDAVAGMGRVDAAGSAPTGWTPWIAVADIDRAVGAAQSLGGEVLGRVRTSPMGASARVVDPLGAEVGLWEGASHPGAQRMREVGTLCWTELLAVDLPRARGFYTGIAGWDWRAYPQSEVPYEVGHRGEVDCCGLMRPQTADEETRWTQYFSVPDARAAVQVAEARGGSVRVPPFATPVGIVAALTDPQGGAFSILQRTASC